MKNGQANLIKYGKQKVDHTWALDFEKRRKKNVLDALIALKWGVGLLRKR